MARSAASHLPSSKRMMALVAVTLLIIGLVPVRYLGWVLWVREPVARVMTPLSAPVLSFVAWIAPPEGASASSEAVAALEQNAAQLEQLYLSEKFENQRLRAQIVQLQRGIALNPQLPVTQFAAPVIGRSSNPSSSMLEVRGGRTRGVTPNTVAVVAGVQLLGRVQRATDSTCLVLPINDPAAGPIGGMIAVDARSIDGPATLLTPTADGTLRGDVEDRRNADGNPRDTIRPGMTVRLRDENYWPANAQMFVLGTVERVETAPDSALRKVVIVRPTVDLRRVSEVVLRIPDQDAQAGGTR